MTGGGSAHAPSARRSPRGNGGEDGSVPLAWFPLTCLFFYSSEMSQHKHWTGFSCEIMMLGSNPAGSGPSAAGLARPASAGHWGSDVWMRNPVEGQRGPAGEKEMGSSARAESWHGGSERWGMWPALGSPPHQTGVGPCPFLIYLRDTMLPMVNPTCVGVLQSGGDVGH